MSFLATTPRALSPLLAPSPTSLTPPSSPLLSLSSCPTKRCLHKKSKNRCRLP